MIRQNGSLSGTLLSKLSVVFAALLLITSALSLYGTFQRKERNKNLESVTESVSKSLRESCSLPGVVSLSRKIPHVEQPYVLVITGKWNRYQLVEISVDAGGNFSHSVILDRKVNSGNFKIESNSPDKIKIRKADRVELEVI